MEAGARSSFKLVLLGDSGVGKTSIFLRIKDNVFQTDRVSTIGVDNFTRRVRVGAEEILISLWDTAGVERFRTITRNFYRNTQAVLLVFSMNEPSSLLYLSKWEQDAMEYAPTAPRFLVGNKTDMDRLVSEDTVEHFAKFHNYEMLFLTSAKTGQGIADVLPNVAKRLLTFHKKHSNEMGNSWLENSIHVNQGEQHVAKSSNCC